MNFSTTDIVIIFMTGFAIILMSFIMPATGLADDSNKTAESDIPEYNVTTDMFKFEDRLPQDVNSPSQGDLIYYENNSKPRRIFARKFTIGGNKWDSVGAVGVNITDDDTTDNELEANITAWAAGAPFGNTKKSFQANDTFYYELNGSDVNYTAEFKAVNLANVNSSDTFAKVEWENQEVDGFSDDGVGWLSKVPLIGGILESGAELAGFVAWLGVVVFFGIRSFVEVILNLGVAATQSIVYVVEMMVFLITSYNGVIKEASTSWATVLVSVPGILLSLEFFKLAAVTISELIPG